MLTVDQNTWLEGPRVRHVPSPFFNARDNETDISLLVIHNISLPPGQFGGPDIECLFQGTLDPSRHPYFKGIAGMQVSAHCLIRRDGEIIQFVPFRARAWHAGISRFAGRDKCNDYSIGIELEGTDYLAYTKAQYQRLQALSQCLMAIYPAITRSRITGHEFIAPQRKTDPGASFDWLGFKHSL